jgi:hypothetical protein
MSKDLIDRGTYYEIKDYEPIVTRDEHSNVVSVINCPYIPKFLFAGGELGSTGVLGRMELSRSKLG